MTKSNVITTSAEIGTLIKSAKGESLPFRQLFDVIAKAIPSSQVVLVSSMPRGGLQIVQPSNCPEILVKGYNRELHAEDRLTWHAIIKGKARLGTVVHKKTAAVLALTEVRSEDKSELAKLVSTIKEGYNDKFEEHKRHWGGGIMGQKAIARQEKKRKALESAIKI